MIINIRGTNASGKTTIVKRLLEDLNGQPLPGGARGRPLGYELDGGIRVVGSYETRTGGCDTVQGAKEFWEGKFTKTGRPKSKSAGNLNTVEALVRQWTAEGHDVVFEGIIVSLVGGRWIKMSQELGGMIWAFLDTPLELCRQRVSERNGGKPLKAIDHLGSGWRRNRGYVHMAFNAGEKVIWLHHATAYEEVRALLAGQPPQLITAADLPELPPAAPSKRAAAAPKAPPVPVVTEVMQAF